MTEEKKNKIISAAVSVGIHVAILIVLSLLTLKYVPENDEEDGVPVMLGEFPDAAGDSAGDLLAHEEAKSVVEEVVPEETVTVPQQEVPTEPTKEPLQTQDGEPSVSATEEEERKKKEVAELKRQEELRKAEEAERKRLEEERKRKEAAERANSKIAGAFGNAKANGNNGKTQGEGLQGSLDGNSNDGATTGVGGAGDNPVAQVGSRKPVYIPKPVYVDPRGAGTVVVAITVNRIGKVTNARIKSTTATEALNNEALSKARMSTFSSGAVDAESGTITYNFRLK